MSDKSPPTMTDVATLAAVSQTTVSLVLNDIKGARISAETIAKVRKAAKSLGYKHKRRIAISATATEQKTVGFVVDEIATDPWMAIALDGMRERAAELGYLISTHVTSGDAELDLAYHNFLSTQNVAGIIYGTIQTRGVTLPAHFNHIPTVLLNCFALDRSFASVTPSEVLGGRSVTEYLIKQGHGRIGMIQGEEWMDASRDRLRGYRQALASAEIAFDAALVRPGNWEPSSGYSNTLELMKLKHPPTAIFCSNDLMALGSYEALKELGMRIPQDVSIFGYDDREVAQFAHPPLSTVLLPHRAIGELALDTLLERIGNPNATPPQIKVECPLVLRDSVLLASDFASLEKTTGGLR